MSINFDNLHSLRYSEPTPDRQLNVVNVSQWEKDTILVCYDYKNSVNGAIGDGGSGGHIVQLVNMNGKPKTKTKGNSAVISGGESGVLSSSSSSSSSEIQFDFAVDSIVALRDGQLLAFHKHGLQGRSFMTNQVTQETADESKEFRLLGSDNLVILESKPLNEPDAYSNLYLLRGHEDLS